MQRHAYKKKSKLNSSTTLLDENYQAAPNSPVVLDDFGKSLMPNVIELVNAYKKFFETWVNEFNSYLRNNIRAWPIPESQLTTRAQNLDIIARGAPGAILGSSFSMTQHWRYYGPPRVDSPYFLPTIMLSQIKTMTTKLESLLEREPNPAETTVPGPA